MIIGGQKETALTGWQASEEVAARWMRAMGFGDAQPGPRVGDHGLDVRATDAVAQVKSGIRNLGQQSMLAQLRTDVAREAPAVKQLLFFTTAGYTSSAILYGRQHGMALFSFWPEPDGSWRVHIEAHSPLAEQLLERAPLSDPDALKSYLTDGIYVVPEWDDPDTGRARMARILMDSAAPGLEGRVDAYIAFSNLPRQIRRTHRHPEEDEIRDTPGMLAEALKTGMIDASAYVALSRKIDAATDLRHVFRRNLSYRSLATANRWEVCQAAHGARTQEALRWLNGDIQGPPFRDLSLPEASIVVMDVVNAMAHDLEAEDPDSADDLRQAVSARLEMDYETRGRWPLASWLLLSHGALPLPRAA